MSEERFDRIEGDLETVKGDVRILKEDVRILKVDVEVLKSDVKVLKSDVKVLKSDVKVLKGDVESLKVGQERLERRVDRNGESLAFLIKQIDQRDRELRSWIEMKFEDQWSRIAVLADGIGANRNRLDDHQGRIESLEAS